MSITHPTTMWRWTHHTVSFRQLLSALRLRRSAPVHNDLLRAGQQAPPGPAFMTVVNGGRLPRT
jgi:hypothetical protein